MVYCVTVEDRGCEVDQAVQIITNKLKERLITCSSGGDMHQVRLLADLRLKIHFDFD